MGHDNIDKHIKAKLEQRTIKPSPEAWGKLSSMLDEESETASKKGYYIYAVAASIVLLLGFFFTTQFNTIAGVVIDDTIVEVKNNEANSVVNKEENAIVDTHLNSDEITNSPKKILNEESKNVNDNHINDQSLATRDSNDKAAINSLKEKVTQYLVHLEHSKQEKLKKKSHAYDLDVEIEALLAEASNRLPVEKERSKHSDFELDKETDILLAAAFQELNLNPAEDVINETLKNKLFKELEKGYFKSKTLLAERSQLTRPY